MFYHLQRCIAILLLAAFTTVYVIMPAHAWSHRLSPYDFSQMYNMAARGDKPRLAAAIARGLNINAVNENGDTGLCVAVRRRDVRAYHTFRAVGANPRPDCSWSIPYFNNFVNADYVRAGAVYETGSYYAADVPSDYTGLMQDLVVGGLIVGGIVALWPHGGSHHKNPCAENPCSAGCFVNLQCLEDEVCTQTNSCGGCEKCEAKCTVDHCAAGCPDTVEVTCKSGQECTHYNECGVCDSCDSTCKLNHCAAGCPDTQSIECPAGRHCTQYNDCGACIQCSGAFVKENVPGQNTEPLTKDGSQEKGTWGGIYTSSYNVDNKGRITLTGDGGFGIMSCSQESEQNCLDGDVRAGPNITNGGEISITGKKGTGIFATTPGSNGSGTYNSGTLTNSGNITITGNDGNGMTLLGHGNINNTGNITMTGEMTLRGEDTSNPHHPDADEGYHPRRNSAIYWDNTSLVNSDGSAGNHMKYTIPNATKYTIKNQGAINITADVDHSREGLSFKYPSVRGISVRFNSLTSANDTIEVDNYNNITIHGKLKNSASSASSDGRFGAIGIEIESSVGELHNQNGSITIDTDYGGTGVYVRPSENVGKTSTFTADFTGDITIANGGAGIVFEGQKLDYQGKISVGKDSQSKDSSAIEVASGDVNIKTNSTLEAKGKNAYGINVIEKLGSGEGNDPKITNNGAINVSGDNAVGISLSGQATGTNETGAKIEVSGTTKAYGVYATQTGDAGFENKGDINVSGAGEVVGMFGDGENGENDETVVLKNSGTITVSSSSSDQAIGMKGRGSKTTLTNTGTITVTGGSEDKKMVCEDDAKGCNGAMGASLAAFELTEGARLVNKGTIMSDGSLNFSQMGDGSGHVVAGKGSRFKAESVSGNLEAGADLTTGSNADNYVESDVVESQDIDLQLDSGSAMFDARLSRKAGGFADIVMARRNFNEILQHNDLANYLEQNYVQNKRIDLYDRLKTYVSAADLDAAAESWFGRNFIPLLAWQNQQRIRHFNQTMQNLALAETNKPERSVATFDGYYAEYEARKNFPGYEDRLSGISTLFDKDVGNGHRYGFGIGVYNAYADFDGDGSRRDVLVQLYQPHVFENRAAGAAVMPYLGYDRGRYKRYSDWGKFEPDFDVWYGGLANRLWLKYPVGSIRIEPTAELNLNVVHQGKITEKQGVEVDADTDVSVEAGLGAFVEHRSDLGESGKLKLRAGAMYYHELNDNVYDRRRAKMSGMNGKYNIGGYETDKDSALFSVQSDYTVGRFSVYGEVRQFVGHNDNVVYNLGLRVAF